jgi:hypothetical protein
MEYDPRPIFHTNCQKTEWWLSFSDDDKFLGACIVQGMTNDMKSIDSAIRESERLRLHPGGNTVVGYPLPIADLPFIGERWRRRLLSWQECEALAAELQKTSVN